MDSVTINVVIEVAEATTYIEVELQTGSNLLVGNSNHYIGIVAEQTALPVAV
ncbi:MAG: hypothetical protein GDA48_01095 [Hormoscilla sp. GM102CHS1]|nr:hypothetical protein [Hormoscilla sp. GM102CHS1]